MIRMVSKGTSALRVCSGGEVPAGCRLDQAGQVPVPAGTAAAGKEVAVKLAGGRRGVFHGLLVTGGGRQTIPYGMAMTKPASESR